MDHRNLNRLHHPGSGCRFLMLIYIQATVEKKLHTAIPGERSDFSAVQIHWLSSAVLIHNFSASIHSDDRDKENFHKIFF